MRWVIVQGIFDIFYFGYVYYFLDVVLFGDEFYVIIVCGENVMYKLKLIFDGCQCCDMVVVFDVVDEVYFGYVEDIFVFIEEIDFDVIVFGYD